MEFEIKLNGADWQRELEKLGINPGAGAKPVSVTLQLGDATHIANTSIVWRTK